MRVHAASVNAADYRLMRADPFLARLDNGLFTPKKQVLGVDIAGVVEAVGPGVTALVPGQSVFGDTFKDGLGGAADYVRLREGSLVTMPDGLSFEEAAAVPLAGATALQAVRDAAAVQPGQSVAIQGAGGGVGTFLVQLAKARGATVTAVCGASSAGLVTELGADRVVDYAHEDFTAGAAQYDVIFGVNGYHPLAHYKRALKPGGLYLIMASGEKTRRSSRRCSRVSSASCSAASESGCSPWTMLGVHRTCASYGSCWRASGFAR